MPRVLILKADRFFAEAIRHSVLRIAVAAEVTAVHRIEEAAAIISQQTFDLLITGIGLPDGDGLDFVAARVAGHCRLRRVFIVTARKEPRSLPLLRQLPVCGVFDSGSEGQGDFESALGSVLAGDIYWSRSFIHFFCDRYHGVCRSLTGVEERVLAILGDGTDDKEAAEILGMKFTYVHSIRRTLHRKLGVRHRGELVRVAVELGFVRFVHGLVQRPGHVVVRAARRDSTSLNASKNPDSEFLGV